MVPKVVIALTVTREGLSEKTEKELKLNGG